MSVQLSIVIVNYNVKYFLEHCLLSVIKACADITAEIFVVDNNSTDGSEEYLSPKFPEVKFRWNKTNPGFAKANNSVLKEATGERILFLNPDTMVPEDCFTKCLVFFGEQKDCGALGVKMLDGSGKFLPESKRSFPSLAAGFFKITGLTKIFSSATFFSGYYAGHLSENETGTVEVLAGAFMMLDRKAIEKTQGFDEDFFMYGEDIDLSYRITMAGMHNYYFAETAIIHFKGESTQKQSAGYTKHFYNAMKMFADKHHAQNPRKLFFLKAGISISKAIAGIKNKFTPASRSKTGNNTEVILLGSESDTLPVKEILLQAPDHSATEIKDSVPPDYFDKTVGNNESSTIVFCEGSLSVKEIIGLLPRLSKKASALFHMKNAESIIGSPDKNSRGVFITKC